MHECIHMGNDINSGQEVEKVIWSFWWFVYEIFLTFFIIKKEIRIEISLLINNIVNFTTPLICRQELMQSFITLE
jgi:hypothetical protein